MAMSLHGNPQDTPDTDHHAFREGGSVRTRWLGLKLGADDYMINRLIPNELVARVKAVLRRTVMTQAVTTAAPVSIAEVYRSSG